MYKIFISISISLLWVLPSYSQGFLVHGQVKDYDSKESLIFARIYDSKNNKLYVSDLAGKFCVALHEGDTTYIYTSYTGYPGKLTMLSYTMDSVIITLESVKPGGLSDFAAQKQYYLENKHEIDSLNALFRQYDEIMKDLEITKLDQQADVYMTGKKATQNKHGRGARTQKTE